MRFVYFLPLPSTGDWGLGINMATATHGNPVVKNLLIKDAAGKGLSLLHL